MTSSDKIWSTIGHTFELMPLFSRPITWSLQDSLSKVFRAKNFRKTTNYSTVGLDDCCSSRDHQSWTKTFRLVVCSVRLRSSTPTNRQLVNARLHRNWIINHELFAYHALRRWKHIYVFLLAVMDRLEYQLVLKSVQFLLRNRLCHSTSIICFMYEYR